MTAKTERLKKIEDVIEQIKTLRKSLKELDLLTTIPVNIPVSIRLIDTNKEIVTYVHNILEWILGVVYDARARLNK